MDLILAAFEMHFFEVFQEIMHRFIAVLTFQSVDIETNLQFNKHLHLDFGKVIRLPVFTEEYICQVTSVCYQSPFHSVSEF